MPSQRLADETMRRNVGMFGLPAASKGILQPAGPAPPTSERRQRGVAQ